MSIFEDARRRFALYYVINHKPIEDVSESGEVLKPVVQWDHDWQQIRKGQEWAATHAAEDNLAAALCIGYALSWLGMSESQLPSDIRETWWRQGQEAAEILVGHDFHMIGDLIEAARQKINAIIKDIPYLTDELKDFLFKIILAIHTDQDSALSKLVQMPLASRLALSRGRACADMGDFQQAIKFFEEALNKSQEANHPEMIVDSLLSLGEACRGLGLYQAAFEHHEKALEIARQNNLPVYQCLFRLGNDYRATRQFEKALENYQQALDLGCQTNDKNFEAAILDAIGSVYGGTDKAEEAIKYHQKALVIGQTLANRRLQGSILGNLGKAHSAIHQFEKAIGFFEQARSIFDELNLSLMVTQTNHDIVLVRNMQRLAQVDALQAQGQKTQAIQLLEEARQDMMSVNEVEHATMINNRIKDLKASIHPKDVSTSHDSSSQPETSPTVGAFRSSKITDRWAKLSTLPGHEMLLKGDFQKANENYVAMLQQAMQLRGMGGELMELPAMRGLGILSTEARKFNLAREAFEKESYLAWQSGNPLIQAIASADQGYLYTQTGDFAKALECYRSALSYAEMIQDLDLIDFIKAHIVDVEVLQSASVSKVSISHQTQSKSKKSAGVGLGKSRTF